MARGFESKSVADQQEARQAEKPAPRDLIPPDQKRLQLARADLEQRLRRATHEPHRVMLQRALDAIDGQGRR
jgi:hypothetical protein